MAPTPSEQTRASSAETGRIPLYREMQHLTGPTPAANLGLWHEKFYAGWGSDWQAGAVQKKTWLDKVVQAASSGAAQIQPHLVERRERIEALVAARGGYLGVFRTLERLVTGTGRPHPVNNGFAFHHLLGVPYLPASSLKGLIRASCAGDPKRSELVAALGSLDQVGAFQLLDALPVEPPRLVIEVLTPHYGGWTTTHPPGDWCGPIPVPYLAVEAGALFLVAILARRGRHPDILEQLWPALVEALAHQGIGARTSIGFGRLEILEQIIEHGAAPRPNAGPTPPEAKPPRPQSPAERWQVTLLNLGDQGTYEQARAMAISGTEDPATLAALTAALDALGYLPAWRTGRQRGKETTGAKKLRELAARLDQLGEPGTAATDEQT